MMPVDKGNGRTIFVGNIPYGVSEEEVIEIFSRQGTVNHFRLVYDKETSKPKGFGFLEYADPECAAAAVRNLHEYPIQGRTLRVDWSNDKNLGGDPVTSFQSNGLLDSRAAVVVAPTSTALSGLPPMPPGIENNALAAPDAISQTLAAMPAHQLLDVISQMKGMVAENPTQVTQLFTAAPQLAYAIFQALLNLGLVDTSLLGSIIQATASAPPPAPLPHVAQPPQPSPYAQMHGYPPYPQQPHVATPPVQHLPYQPPPPPPPTLQAMPSGNQEELIRQVIAMTRDQIFALPADQRDQIITLRAHFGHPV